MGTLFLVAILSLSLFSISRTQRIVEAPPQRPLCASQYVLANYACSRLPMFTPTPPSFIHPPPPPPPPLDLHDHVHVNDDEDKDHQDDKDHDHDNEHNHDHDHNHNHHSHDHANHDHNHNHNSHDHDHEHHNHDHNHDNHDHDHNHENHDHGHDSEHHKRHMQHHHHHPHNHRHIEEETNAQKECCKWLKQMDNECVCDLLVRLPLLLARPAHGYTVFVDESCIVTYTCPGRILP